MPVLIDAHVHIHPFFDLNSFFVATFNNLESIISKYSIDQRHDSVIILTEGGENHVFSFMKQKGKHNIGDISFQDTEEPGSLIAERKGKKLVLVSGRQIISLENLELLIIGNDIEIEDRKKNIMELIKVAQDHNSIPIIPWGVGKWLGKRGKIIEKIINTRQNKPLLLGDNGNRPSLWPKPKIFKQAIKNNIPILSGSDPLPLKSHTTRAGTFGSYLPEKTLDMTYPAKSLNNILTSVSPQDISDFGSTTPLHKFFKEQMQINICKRLSC